MNRILFIRHGQTSFNEEGRLQGWLDIPLNETGRLQAGLTARRLAQMRFDAIYSSDLERSVTTAQIIANRLKDPPQITPLKGLREFDYGRWAGLIFPEIEEQFPDDLQAWNDNLEDFILPEGESLAQFSERVQSTIQETLKDKDNQSILAVTHGGTIRALLCAALGVPPSHFRRLSIEPTSLTEIHYEGSSAVVYSVNDVAHMQKWAYRSPSES